MANFLSDLIKGIRYDILHDSNLQNLFASVDLELKEELNYPTLFIQIADVTNEGWWGYYDVTLFLSIIDNKTAVDAMNLFDSLLQYYNRYSGPLDPTNTAKYEIEYTGGYESTYDPDNGEHIITSVWRARSLKT